jgi:PIN domain nuclease of toxin-antitoxin system
MMPGAVLLDTCAMIYIANGETLEPGSWDQIAAAGLADGVYVSPVSAWEIGLLSRPGRRSISFLPDPATWVRRFMARSVVKPAELSNDIAIAASHLPGPLHGDPADRLLIATARDLGMPLVTRDRKIIDYAEAGHVSVLVC